jgi:NADPH:quinone reductase-like Zn-dependent oxidoreductase
LRCPTFALFFHSQGVFPNHSTRIFFLLSAIQWDEGDNMPKIIRFHQLGGPEVLRFEEAEPQRPGKGEVRIRVQASGLNRAESVYMRGRYFEQPQLPSRIGYEVAGVVEAVGEGVDACWIGKPVATVPGFSQNRYGTLGEETVVPVEVLGEYPANLTPVQAAAIWMQFLTAYGALVLVGGIKAGDFVSIPAASSSVGLAAIQIARDHGATAIAVTRSAAKREELLALGAHHVIVSDKEDYPARMKEITGGKGARITFDPVAGPGIEHLAEGAANSGHLIEYGALDGGPTPFPLIAAMTKGLNVHGYTMLQVTHDPAIAAKAKKYVFDRLAEGRFVPKIARTFPFTQTIEAYQYLESNQQVGKVVITVP